MRVSELSRTNARIGYLQSVTERMDRIQQELSTGHRIQRASDDPAGAALALGHREAITYETQMRRNLESGVSFLNASEAALGGVTDALQRIRELTVQASTGTLSQPDRTAIAEEVNQLIGQVGQLANTNFGGAYVFSGHQSQTPAYLVTGNPPTSVTYQGDAGLRIRRISKQDAVAVNVPGTQVFGTVFNDLITLRDNLMGSVPGPTIAASLVDLDAALTRVLDSRADLGARANRFDAAQRVSETTDTDLQELRANIEDTDLPSTIVKFTAEQNALQAALGAIGRTSDMSLLNFLR
jgi:flagellar hook-associated protein 3 FlgL